MHQQDWGVPVRLTAGGADRLLPLGCWRGWTVDRTDGGGTVTGHHAAAYVDPLTLAWVGRHLERGERVVRTEALHGGITAEMRRLTIGTAGGATRDLVLRSFVDPLSASRAQDWLNRETDALNLLGGTGVPAPGLVAADPTAAHCAYPSLLMTHVAGAAPSSTTREWRHVSRCWPANSWRSTRCGPPCGPGSTRR